MFGDTFGTFFEFNHRKYGSSIEDDQVDSLENSGIRDRAQNVDVLGRGRGEGKRASAGVRGGQAGRSRSIGNL